MFPLNPSFEALAASPLPPPHIVYPAQAPYLTNNWRNIQASNEYSSDYTKYVRVLSGVANITNGHVLVRYFLEVPDGFYLIREDKTLIEVFPALVHGFPPFPDVESKQPDFMQMDKSGPVLFEEISNFVGYLNYIRSGTREMQSGVVVHMEGRTVAVLHKKDALFSFSCELPVKYDGLIFDANNLRLAFTEMLRYDHIYIGHDNRRPEATSPLVIGSDWGHCAIISEERHRR